MPIVNVGAMFLRSRPSREIQKLKFVMESGNVCLVTEFSRRRPPRREWEHPPTAEDDVEVAMAVARLLKIETAMEN